MSKTVAPSPEQLRVVVDRAARRLSAEEGELLRAGVAALERARADLTVLRREVGAPDTVTPSRAVGPSLPASGAADAPR
ncbi:hypothetical protein ACIO6U_02885 [Streptomyces sp. NPDC087422]|uniref:hypothetical protein n=1 Tax=Streptomyces sp. NPDC087422 TaxID=3365786 RepID=UPI0038182938